MSSSVGEVLGVLGGCLGGGGDIGGSLGVGGEAIYERFNFPTPTGIFLVV